ncbi:ABC transporter substrate-binding protein [Georgenia alba]|uniref:ABC transporter substrate-binding protein n=1 Tax=Georgenia alba TaxID=2233858 RepID=A0ABW2Q818_9MICO
MTTRRRLLATAAVAAAALAACSGSPDTDDGAPRTVRLAGVAVGDMAAVYVGQRQGYFAEAGLELDITLGSNSPAMIPALVNDEFDVQYGASVNLLQAIDRGLPLVAVATGGRSTGVPGEDHGGLLVAHDSTVRRPADLEGATVAVNALGGLLEVCVHSAIAHDGGDPGGVDFVELPLPEMPAALESGQVDAIATAEPFLGIALGEGHRLVSSVYVDTVPDRMVTATYYVTEEKLAAEPETVEAFVRALERSFEYAQQHPGAVREELRNFTDIAPELIDQMVLTDFTWGLSSADLAVVAEAAADAGTLEDPEAATDQAARYVDGR